MYANKRIDRLSGILMLLMLVTVVVSGAIAASVPLNYDEAGKTLQNVAGRSGQHMADILFDLLSYIAMVFLAGALYVTFKPYDKMLSILGTLGLVVAGAILAVHDMINFAITPIAHDYVAASGAEAVALEAVGGALILLAKWGVTVGYTFFALGILVYSVIVILSRAVPRVLGWLGVVASVLALGTWLPRIDNTLDPIAMALFVPMMLWELVFGIWLIVRGTKKVDGLAGVTN